MTQHWKVLRKLLRQSWPSAALALFYALWEFSSLPPGQRTLAAFIRSWGVTFFLVMWFVGQWFRASKQISDDEQLRGIRETTDKMLEMLRQRTEAAVEEAGLGEGAGSVQDQGPPKEDAMERVLAVIPNSPKAALVLLSAEIEREVRRLLWSSGWFQGVGQATVRKSIEHLMELGVLTPKLAESVRDFLDIRNRLVHGRGVTEDEIVRGIDIGLTILRAILAIPAELNHVYDPGIDVFEDPQCLRLRPGIKAVVLETTSPDRSKKTLRFFPTTRTDYQKGQRVSWEWNPRHIVLQSWVHRPDTGVIDEAWTQAAEFVGRNLDEI